MWDWLRRHRERRKDARQRFEYERDRRILGELEANVKQRERREKHLIHELVRLEKALRKVNQ
jgi:predicted  nucleic acid-binding Zn-ribbon protein